MSTSTGQLFSFLAALPIVFDFYGNKVGAWMVCVWGGIMDGWVVEALYFA